MSSIKYEDIFEVYDSEDQLLYIEKRYNLVFPEDLRYFWKHYKMGVPKKTLYFKTKRNIEEVEIFYFLLADSSITSIAHNAGLNTCVNNRSLVPILNTFEEGVLFYDTQNNHYSFAANYFDVFSGGYDLKNLEYMSNNFTDIWKSFYEIKC